MGQWPAGMNPPQAGAPVVPLEKPTAAFVLSLIGGIIILLWGIALAAVGIAAQNATFGLYGGDITFLGGVEATLGLLVLVFGVLLYIMPQHHVVFGVLVLLFSIVSLVGLGGLILGFILGVIGGAFGIAHKTTPTVVVSPYPVYYAQGPPMAPYSPQYGQPSPQYGQPSPPAAYPPTPAPAPPPAAERYCPSCGTGNSRASAFCAKCGKPLPPPS